MTKVRFGRAAGKRSLKNLSLYFALLCRCANVYSGVGGRGVNSHMKGVGMLGASLRGVNFRFWSHLGCSEQNSTKFSCQSLVWGCTQRNIKKNFLVLFTLLAEISVSSGNRQKSSASRLGRAGYSDSNNKKNKLILCFPSNGNFSICDAYFPK